MSMLRKKVESMVEIQDSTLTYDIIKVASKKSTNWQILSKNAKVKQHYKDLYHSIKITRAKTTDQNNSLLSEIEHLKDQLKENSKCVTIPDCKPKVLAPGRYPIDVEPIPPRLKKNREVHLHYIKRLKENVETLREIVEDAKSGPRDKQNASTNSLRKKGVTFVEPCETSTHNTPPQVEHQKINSTNVPGIPSTGVKGASAASRSKPRSNTKKDRTLPAKSALKQVEAHSRMNKSNEKHKNRVDLLLAISILKSSATKVWRFKQVKQVWKAIGKLFTTIGHQWSTALKSDCLPAEPTGNYCPVANNPACTNQPTPIAYWGSNVSQISIFALFKCRVYYVEGLGHNLFSVGQFCDSDLKVAFRQHTCFVRDLDGVDLIKGSRGTKLYTISVEDMMRFTWVKFLRSKDETPVFVINLLKQLQVGLNKTVWFVRTDNGTEFVNKNLTDFYKSVGITHEKTVRRTPQHNGVVERRNHTLVEAARTMLIFSKAPLFLWAEALATTCYTQNRSLIHTLHNKTPYELVHDKKPDLSFLRIFGALCYPTNNSKDLGKLKAKADIGFFVG
ncbi:integrase, catalytic region, zinc finger, CCHC-type containing protein [Tanacetum coccineum]